MQSNSNAVKTQWTFIPLKKKIDVYMLTFSHEIESMFVIYWFFSYINTLLIHFLILTLYNSCFLDLL